MARLADVIGEIGDLVSSARDKFHMRTASSFEPRLADMATTIALDRPVHFLAADDSELELDAGLYGVTARGNGYLTLTSLEHWRTSVIRAQETFHELLPNSPLALTVP
jgi:hypothetical protein